VLLKSRLFHLWALAALSCLGGRVRQHTTGLERLFTSPVAAAMTFSFGLGLASKGRGQFCLFHPTELVGVGSVGNFDPLTGSGLKP
jgi:hypothetical protein